MNKGICKDCTYCSPYYGTKDKVTKYWCAYDNGKAKFKEQCPNFSKSKERELN